MDFGAFVEILPGKEGLVHISQLADYHVNRPEDVVKIGDEITVMVIEVDPQGRVNLSRRAALSGEMPSAADLEADRGGGMRGPRGGGGGGGRGGFGGPPPRDRDAGGPPARSGGFGPPRSTGFGSPPPPRTGGYGGGIVAIAVAPHRVALAPLAPVAR